MSDHDPLCPEGQMNDPERNYYMCECELITEVRADERNKIEKERSPIWSEAMGGD